MKKEFRAPIGDRLGLLGSTAGLALILSGFVAPSGAYAQASSEPAQNATSPSAVPGGAAEPANALTEEAAATIVVTGTRITRNGFQSPTPTTVLGAAQLALTSPTNIADAVNNLPSLAAGYSPRLSNTATSGGIGGLNVLNLRNIGITRTLVLLDGRRIAPSTSSGLVNVNTIPEQLIDRVDVVTGGASAAYGSDAIAGVVNFILKKNFTGLLVDAQTGISNRGDGGTRKVSASFGTAFAGGRGHFVLSGELSDQDGIYNTDGRKFFNGTKLVGNPAGGTPALIYAAPVNVSTATAGGLIIKDPANGPLQGIQFGPGGAPSNFIFGTPTGTANLMIGGTPNDALAQQVPIAAKLDNRQLYSRVGFDITPDVTVYAEGSYGKSHVFNPTVFQFKLGNLVIQRDNAFLPASIKAQMAAAGLTSVKFGTYNGDIGELRIINDLNSYRGMAGIDAQLGGSWALSAYYQYGRTNATNADENETITSRYNQAIDAIVDPVSGAIVCRNQSNGCVPLNIIGTGVASNAALGYVTGTALRKSVIQQHVASVSIQGKPFSTWAGPVSIAFGGEYRRESSRETVDALSLASSYFTGNFKPVNGMYNVKEAFAETIIPLAKDLPFAKSLELNGAIRETDYSTSGYVTTWKAGATWRPIEDILFRVVRSRDIRAPNLADLFANSQFTQVVSDPANGNRSDTIAAFINAGNPDLKPEVSKNLTAGVVLTPRLVPGFSVSFDYYHLDITSFITSLASSAQAAVNLCVSGSAAACSLVTRDATGHITAVRLAGVNAGRLATRGFDVEASYRKDLSQWSAGLGILNIRFLLSRLNSLSINTSLATKQYAGEVSGQNAPFIPQVGYFPKTRFSVTTSYEKGGLTLGLVGRYIGPGVVDNSYTAANISTNHVASVFYTDGSVSYRIDRVRGRPEFYLAVDNLLDKKPPVVGVGITNQFLSQGTSTGFYDAIGRFYRAGVRLHF